MRPKTQSELFLAALVADHEAEDLRRTMLNLCRTGRCSPSVLAALGGAAENKDVYARDLRAIAQQLRS